MTPVKILVVLFSIVDVAQIAMMSGGNVEKTRLTRYLKLLHIDFDIYPGFTISILVFVVLVFAIFAFFKHYISFKEHYSSFLRFLICANLFISFFAVLFNFYLYFVRG